MSRSIGSPGGSRSAISQSMTRRADSGFTLLEIIVAVAILAVSLAALLQVFSSGLKGARVAQHHTIATLLAESKLATIGVEAPLEEAETSGEYDDDYGLRAAVRRYQEPGPDAAAESPVVAYEVVVTVSWEETGGVRSVSLSTLRLAPAAR